jgi:hypothetical protein
LVKSELNVNWLVFGYINIIVIHINSCLNILLKIAFGCVITKKILRAIEGNWCETHGFSKNEDLNHFKSEYRGVKKSEGEGEKKFLG